MIEGIILSRNGSFKTDGESYIEDGILSLENDKTRIISATDFASIDSLKVAGTSSEGKSRLAVYCEYDDISEAIRFVSDSGTAIREYKMFGEHNIDLLSPVIQNLLTGGEISMVKKVQRGVTQMTSGAVAVTIEAVNPEKSFAIVNAFGHYGSPATSSANDYALGGYLLNSTTVQLFTESSNNNPYLAWQVIEFY